MILSEKLLSLTKKIANLENTEEDKVKWQSAYLEVFEKGYFAMSRDELEKFISSNIVDTPLTTYGEISLIKHIKRVNIDLKQLAKTTEIAVRFLDGCLDVINFSQEAKEKIEMFRKIGVGVSDFDAFCVQTGIEQSKAIYNVAELIAKAAYRASESLGVYRGAINNNELTKAYNRGKIFANYIRLDAEELLNGFEFKRLSLAGKIDPEQYTLVPRRNSHILLFPNQEIWFQFTDRVEADYIPFNETPSLQVSNAQPSFGKGELVEVVNHFNAALIGKIFQVIDHKLFNNSYQFFLKGDGLANNTPFKESELKSVDLNFVLNKLNFESVTTNQPSENVFFTYGLILSKDENSILIDRNTGYLPQFQSYEELSPEAVLITGFQKKYGLDAEILDEIGSVKEVGSVGIAYWVSIISEASQDLVWIGINEIESNSHFQIIFNKLNRKKKIYQRYESIIIKLEQDKERLSAEISGTAKSILLLQEKRSNLTITDRIGRMFSPSKKTNEFLRLPGGNAVENFDYDDDKFVLSLQQNILTDEFGSIRIIMEYSKAGMKSLQLFPEVFNADSRFLLDLYLEMINMGLQYGVTKGEYANMLYKYENELPVNDLYEVVKIIRKTLTAAPETFEELSQKVY